MQSGIEKRRPGRPSGSKDGEHVKRKSRHGIESPRRVHVTLGAAEVEFCRAQATGIDGVSGYIRSLVEERQTQSGGM